MAHAAVSPEGTDQRTWSERPGGDPTSAECGSCSWGSDMSHLPDAVSSPGPSKPPTRLGNKALSSGPSSARRWVTASPVCSEGEITGPHWASHLAACSLSSHHVPGQGPSRARSAFPLRIESSNELGYLFSFFMSR